MRLLDETAHNRARQKFEYDMIIGQWLTVAAPGGEQRARWGTGSANQEGSTNMTGASSPAIDAMIDSMVEARSPDEFVAAARALDRVLLSGFYFVPLHHATELWTAHSAKLARPSRAPRFPMYPFGMLLDNWWFKEP